MLQSFKIKGIAYPHMRIYHSENSTSKNLKGTGTWYEPGKTVFFGFFFNNKRKFMAHSYTFQATKSSN